MAEFVEFAGFRSVKFGVHISVALSIWRNSSSGGGDDSFRDTDSGYVTHMRETRERKLFEPVGIPEIVDNSEQK